MLNPSLKDLGLSPEESKEVAKFLVRKRGIKGYKSMPDDKLLCALKASKSEKNFDKIRTEKIREELKKLGHKFSKSEINESRQNLYEIENKKDLSEPRIKEIKENLFE